MGWTLASEESGGDRPKEIIYTIVKEWKARIRECRSTVQTRQRSRAKDPARQTIRRQESYKTPQGLAEIRSAANVDTYRQWAESFLPEDGFPTRETALHAAARCEKQVAVKNALIELLA